ncbi:hypothetical protein VTK56DRAFT_36 [Thermocarpiscus australiensis]
MISRLFVTAKMLDFACCQVVGGLGVMQLQCRTVYACLTVLRGHPACEMARQALEKLHAFFEAFHAEAGEEEACRHPFVYLTGLDVRRARRPQVRGTSSLVGLSSSLPLIWPDTFRATARQPGYDPKLIGASHSLRGRIPNKQSRTFIRCFRACSWIDDRSGCCARQQEVWIADLGR